MAQSQTRCLSGTVHEMLRELYSRKEMFERFPHGF